MGIVELDISMSLDGFITGPNSDAERPLGDGGERLHDWAWGGEWTQGEGGVSPTPVGADAEILRGLFADAGAVVVGRRVYDQVDGWGEDPPFAVPCFVVTHRPHETTTRGRATFTFVTAGVGSAIARAKAVAGDRRVNIIGGADVAQQALRPGLVDELAIHLAPVVLGAGTRLFDGLAESPFRLERTSVVDSPLAAHMRFRVLSTRPDTSHR